MSYFQVIKEKLHLKGGHGTETKETKAQTRSCHSPFSNISTTFALGIFIETFYWKSVHLPESIHITSYSITRTREISPALMSHIYILLGVFRMSVISHIFTQLFWNLGVFSQATPKEWVLRDGRLDYESYSVLRRKIIWILVEVAFLFTFLNSLGKDSGTRRCSFILNGSKIYIF